MLITVMDTSRPETRGFMVANQSHRAHMEYIRNRTWDKHEGATSGYLEFMRIWKHQQREQFYREITVSDIHF